MPTDEDFLDRVWEELINIDANGEWLKKAIRDSQLVTCDPMLTCYPALERLSRSGLIEQLSRVSRRERYEACFGVLCTLEQWGFPEGGITALSKMIEELVEEPSKPPRHSESIKGFLHVTLSPIDEGEWAVSESKAALDGGPFGDAAWAVRSLVHYNVQPSDLGRLAAWSRLDACRGIVRLLDECEMNSTDRFEGMSDVLLSADPSGTDASPSSWPWSKVAAKKKERSGSGDELKPLWRTKSGQGVAFSPDSQSVAIAGPSGPARLYAVQTGEVTATFEGLKIHISHLAFNPDGTRMAVAQMYDRLCVCDVVTGKMLGKGVFGDTKASHSQQVSGLAFSRLTGDLLRSAWKQEIDVINPETVLPKESLRPSASTRHVDAMMFYPQHDHLAAVRSGKSLGEKYVTVWKWPEREVTLRFGFKSDFTHDMAMTSDAKLFAFPYDRYACPDNDRGVLFFNASTGVQVNEWKGMGRGGIGFLPGTNILIAGSGPSICFGKVTEPKPKASVQLCASTGEVGGIWISPDGRHLAIQAGRGVGVWTTDSLLAAGGFRLE